MRTSSAVGAAAICRDDHQAGFYESAVINRRGQEEWGAPRSRIGVQRASKDRLTTAYSEIFFCNNPVYARKAAACRLTVFYSDKL